MGPDPIPWKITSSMCFYRNKPLDPPPPPRKSWTHWEMLDLLLLPLSAGPSLEHYRTEYLQGASEAWLKTGKSDLKTDKNIPQLYLVVTGQPSLEGLQGWRCDDTLW